MELSFTVWVTIAVMHAVAVASPGPDFAVVLKQSLQHGRSAGLLTSIGVGTGILVHVAYSLLGFGIIIASNPDLFNWLLYIAAAYLIWIGIGAIRSAPPEAQSPVQLSDADSDKFGSEELVTQQTVSQAPELPVAPSKWSSFVLGFVTNGLNPKATLFFLALFSVAIPIETSMVAKTIYGIYLAVATGCWFCLVTWLASHKSVRKVYQKKGYWFDRIMGFVIILMALALVFSN